MQQADKSQIFSQEALDKLRSPEKLDTMLPITTPISWMALIAILCCGRFMARSQSRLTVWG